MAPEPVDRRPYRLLEPGIRAHPGMLSAKRMVRPINQQESRGFVAHRLQRPRVLRRQRIIGRALYRQPRCAHCVGAGQNIVPVCGVAEDWDRAPCHKGAHPIVSGATQENERASGDDRAAVGPDELKGSFCGGGHRLPVAVRRRAADHWT